MAYQIILSIHILAVISWMAGILYLFRLFVNHRDAGFDNESVHSLMVGMEERLYRIITLPAMVVAVGAGLGLTLLSPSFWGAPWFLTKFSAVMLLIFVTFLAKRFQLRFAQKDEQLPPGRTFRILNEVPTLLMIIIVFLVVLKPF